MKNYGTYIIADPEEPLSEQELQQITFALEKEGVNIIIFAEWYN